MRKISIFLSLILRHRPDVINITLDEHGWADVNELIENINKTRDYKMTFEILEKIVASDEKMRYSFNEDKTKIRANQGHSINVDVELKTQTPPEYLYHGTADKSLDSIISNGIESRSRLHVHLTDNKETAVKTGTRHGKPVVLKINALDMHANGHKFYLSENNVWLTDSVPSKYITEVMRY